jgi:hypothetical protein
VFSEFLNENVVDAAGVNYARHMVPILSGLSEAGGWVYENDQAAQVMMSRGLFWHNPLPMIALAARYDVEYIVAGSPNFVRALAEDPRWRRILETDHVSLFEAVGREPSSVEASGWNPRVASEGYTPGGGYEYRIELEPDGRVDMSRELLVRTSWSPAWRAHIGDRELRVTPTDDALASVTLPETRAPATLMLTWDIGELRGKGNRLSLAALIVTLVLLALVALPKLAWLDIVPADLPRWGGVVLAAVAVALAASRGRPIDENVVGFGIRGGMAVTFDSKRVEVGAFDDAEDVRLVRVLERAWGPRALLRGAPARTLAGNEASAAVVTLSPVGPNRLTVRGLALEKSGNERSDAPISMVLRDSGTAETLCRLDTRLGIPTLIPGECVTGPTSQGPGTSRQLALVAEGGLVVSGIDLDNGIALVEAETMHNVLDDGGYDAFYALGRPDEFASNGVSMRARSGYERPIALDRVVALPSAAYDVWVLMRTVSPRLHNGQGHLLIQADGVDLADVDPRPRNVVPFWESDSHLEWLPAGRVQGGTTRRIRVTCHRLETAFDGLCDLDAIAFVPAS